MGKQQVIEINGNVGVHETSGADLVREFLKNHGAGLEDLVGRFPEMSGPGFRIALGKNLCPDIPAYELMLALEEAADTLIWLQSRDPRPQYSERSNRSEVECGLRWYAARLGDLAVAISHM